MKRILVLLIIQVTIGNVYAQYQANLPESSPIPPNAAALFKGLEKPVGTYTGTVPISFPLATVISGSLSAAISLDYTSTGGIKVEELSSSIGLGFNLSDGGGRITQVIRGKSDIAPDGLVNNSNVKPSAFNCTMSQLDLTQQHLDLLDLEPDIYMYSCNGHSGKFFLKEDGSIVLMQNDPVKITYTVSGGNFQNWTITDEKGNTYFFSSRTLTMSSYTSPGGSTSNTVTSWSWYLDDMNDMNLENKIHFTYTGTGHSFTTMSGIFYPLDANGLGCSPGFNTVSAIGTVTSDGLENIVSRIDGRTGWITFSTAQDYASGPLHYTGLQVYDSSGNLKNQYKFNYGTPFSSNRQKLVNFSEFGASGSDSITYKFTYNETVNLPAVTSYSVDMWGYYNNAANSGYVPNVAFANGSYLVYHEDWDNRTPNATYAQANILKRITYPTGGYREFDYEGNRVFANGDYFRYYPDPEYMITKTFTATGFSNVGSFMPALKKLFTVHTYLDVTKFSFTLNGVTNCGTDYEVDLYKLTDSTDLTGGTLVTTFAHLTTGSIILLPGYYRADINILNNNFSCSMTSMGGSWRENPMDTVTYHSPNWNIAIRYSKWEHNAGGVRVKEVRDYDPLTGKIKRTNFYYKLYSADSTHTSGQLVSPLNITAIENIATCGCNYHKLYQQSSYPLSADGNSYVVYPEVRTVDSGGGKTDRYYNFLADVLSFNFPLVPATDYSAYRGKLITEKIYDQAGNLLKKTINNWGVGSASGSQIGRRVKAYWFVYPASYYETFTTGQPVLGICNSYTLNTGPAYLAETIDSVYSSFGVQALRTVYLQTTNNGLYLPQKKISFINGNRTREQCYKYAFTPNSEFRLGLTAGEQTTKSTLLTKNFLQPLEIDDSVRVGSGSPSFLTGYKYIFQSSGKIRLSQFRTFTTPTDSIESNFSSYDAFGNCTEAYKTNGLKEITIWGYRGQYPVAKVIGSTYSAVVALINLTTVNNPSSDAAMRTELDKIRTGLAGSVAQVTTYTYSPLYGMTSVTDPAGRTTYYEYDPFGRLMIIRDKDNNILKKYEYKLNNPL